MGRQIFAAKGFLRQKQTSYRAPNLDLHSHYCIIPICAPRPPPVAVGSGYSLSVRPGWSTGLNSFSSQRLPNYSKMLLQQSMSIHVHVPETRKFEAFLFFIHFRKVLKGGPAQRSEHTYRMLAHNYKGRFVSPPPPPPPLRSQAEGDFWSVPRPLFPPPLQPSGSAQLFCENRARK